MPSSTRWRFRNHPGNVPLIGMTVLGAVAGGWPGAAIMLALFGSVYLFGAYEGGGRDA